ncbi:zinc finger protein [Forsythia ovata]|uniref:Zinc finger protein n=1 Tax=Forsythia ovata TaxID=205694 RepID=A0ABD1XDX0_9LAMI
MVIGDLITTLTHTTQMITTGENMGSINVLVYFGGEWNSSRMYNGYSIVGVIIPVDCSYSKFVEIILRELKRNQLECAITIQYQITKNGPPVAVCSDSSLYFFIEVKKNDRDMTKFPLCVEIENVAPRNDNMMCLGNEFPGYDNIPYPHSMTNDFSNGCMETLPNPVMPTIEEMGSAIVEYVKYPDNSSKDIECDIIFRPSIQGVKAPLVRMYDRISPLMMIFVKIFYCAERTSPSLSLSQYTHCLIGHRPLIMDKH